MAKTPFDPIASRPKVLIIGIYAPYNKTSNIQSYYDEFVNLVKSNSIPYDNALFMKLRTIDPATFVSQGKLEEINELCEKEGVDHVIISEPLSQHQARNLTDILHAKVFDRTDLILDIFEKSAHSAEGKTQVAIARLQHSKSRLAGKGATMSQQGGIMGLRGGPGETAKEKERRHIEEAILKLSQKLKQLEKTRATQRKQRLNNRIPLVCLIGYTNAGKSTILNALTHSNTLAEDRLFATLDTTTRELYIDHKKIGLLSDTVGFIQLLPPQLINAFKSTLQELEYADLLLQVVDVSDPNWQDHIAVVHSILDDLNIQKNMLYVFNKVDKTVLTQRLEYDISKYNPHVVISSVSKEGVQPLLQALATWPVKN